MESAAPILCADIGTSSLKAALISTTGELLAFVREPYPADRVLDGTVHASDWEEAFIRAAGALQAAAQQRGNRAQPVGLAISGNGPTLVPVTKSGQALLPLHWHDGRVAKANDGAAHPSLFLPHAAYLAQNEPDQYAHTERFLSSHEWLAWRLGAEPCTVIPNQAYVPYYWDERQIQAYGLESHRFPPFVEQGVLIGSVSAAAAGRTGLPKGLPIISGGPDFITALIGTGVVVPGMVCDRAGTSEGINVCARQGSKARTLRTLPHIQEGLWNVGAILPTTGRLFEWFRHITGQESRDYREMLAEILQCKQCTKPRDFFFPDIRSAGRLQVSSAFFSTAGLTNRAELGYAVIESIAFMVRTAIENLEKEGYWIEGMRLSGGQAKNTYWNQFKADVTGRWLAVHQIEDGELAGNACLAMKGLGYYPSIEAAIEGTVKIKEVFEPVQQRYAMHSERFEVYKTMLHKMERFFE
ncbi:FGGY-family carbohydrate kinase [Gracilinema caldarium]|uniref:xylulokinase n=1 Tax=Gracilinema caldarium TaxID=215591 RepID=UPI0026F04C6F|nr:FGGY-family carbohydrate kinase [Gracilinema caldarium]